MPAHYVSCSTTTKSIHTDAAYVRRLLLTRQPTFDCFSLPPAANALDWHSTDLDSNYKEMVGYPLSASY